MKRYIRHGKKHRKINFRYAIKKAKHERKLDLVKEAIKDKTGQKVWKIARALEPRINKKQKQWQTHSIEAKLQCENIATQFENISNEDIEPMTEREKREYEDTIKAAKDEASREDTDRTITLRELRRALNKANTRSAQGHDGISTKLLVQACNSRQCIENALLQALNHSLISEHEIPTLLKQAKIIPLPKPKPNEYRPNSLLTSLAKLTESIIDNRTRYATQHKLAQPQFGGRAGHNAAQALQRFIHAAGTAAHQKKHFGAISFDFRKAYDRVPIHRIIAKLKGMECPAYLILIITTGSESGSSKSSTATPHHHLKNRKTESPKVPASAYIYG